jgi:hypothetical protein
MFFPACSFFIISQGVNGNLPAKKTARRRCEWCCPRRACLICGVVCGAALKTRSGCGRARLPRRLTGNGVTDCHVPCCQIRTCRVYLLSIMYTECFFSSGLCKILIYIGFNPSYPLQSKWSVAQPNKPLDGGVVIAVAPRLVY